MGLSTQFPEIDRFSVADRLRLIEEIWDSIEDFSESAEIPESHKQELDRRLAAMEADAQAGSTWEEVKARLRGRIGDAW